MKTVYDIMVDLGIWGDTSAMAEFMAGKQFTVVANEAGHSCEKGQRLACTSGYLRLHHYGGGGDAKAYYAGEYNYVSSDGTIHQHRSDSLFFTDIGMEEADYADYKSKSDKFKDFINEVNGKPDKVIAKQVLTFITDEQATPFI